MTGSPCDRGFWAAEFPPWASEVQTRRETKELCTDRRLKVLAGLASGFQALGHQGRLSMIEQRTPGAEFVCALARLLGLCIPTVARHLAGLPEVAIVESEERGLRALWVLWRLRGRGALGCLG